MWTFETIQQWAWNTFGKAEPSRALERAFEEIDELQDSISLGFSSLIVEEAADVIITLLNVEGVPEAIQSKMEVNSNRTWKIMGDGTGYHEKG